MIINLDERVNIENIFFQGFAGKFLAALLIIAVFPTYSSCKKHSQSAVPPSSSSNLYDKGTAYNRNTPTLNQYGTFVEVYESLGDFESRQRRLVAERQNLERNFNNVGKTSSISSADNAVGKTYSPREIENIKYEIENELIPEIERKGGEVVYPVIGYYQKNPNFGEQHPAGLPSGSYKRLYNGLMRGGGELHEFLGNKFMDLIKKDSIVSDIGSGQARYFTLLLSKAKILTSHDIDPNAIKWQKQLISYLHDRYPEKAYGYRVVLVLSKPTDPCLPETDIVTTNNLHVYINDRQFPTQSFENYIKAKKEFHENIFNSVKIGMIIRDMNIGHHYKLEQVIEHYKKIFPEISIEFKGCNYDHPKQMYLLYIPNRSKWDGQTPEITQQSSPPKYEEEKR